MARKYIDDLGIKFEDTPQGFNPCDERQEMWVKDREEFGFDERETWSLDFMFYMWLYERLKMFDEVNCFDTKAHTFEYKGEKLTLQDCIDRMIEGCKLAITEDYYWSQDKELLEKINDVVKIFALCIGALWW